MSSPVDESTENFFDIYMYTSNNEEYFNFFDEIFSKNSIFSSYIAKDTINFVINKSIIPETLTELTIENFEFFTDTRKYYL